MKLRDQNIFILGLTRYGDKIESTNFTLAKHLAKYNNVFYIENPYTWKDFIFNNQRSDLKLRKKYFSLTNGSLLETNIPRLKIVITPPLASINWLPESRLFRIALQFNERVIHRKISQVLKEYNIDDYVFINSFNFYYPGVARLLSPILSVYHCVDPLIFPVDLKHGVVSEAEIVKNSDLVVCTSKQLCSEKLKLNDNTFFIPNAADPELSSAALDNDVAVHPSLAHISGPVAGYFGNIERRIDYELLDKVTAANPSVSFVFTGPIVAAYVPAWFYERRNVYLTGPIPHAQMPLVLKGFDVTIIPFKKDSVSAQIFPLKLFEYLGAGKPVVATDFNPDLEDFTGGAVDYCSTEEQFSNALAAAINNDSPLLRQKRLNIARQNTWETRAREFGDLLHNFIKNGTIPQLTNEKCMA